MIRKLEYVFEVDCITYDGTFGFAISYIGMSVPPEMEMILQESRDSVREAKIQLVMLDQSMVTRYADITFCFYGVNITILCGNEFFMYQSCSIIRQQGARVLLSKQVKYVKEMKDEGSLKGKHADVLFEQIEEDLDRLNKHKYQVFKENVQRVFTNRMSMIQSKNSTVVRESVFDPSASRIEEGAGAHPIRESEEFDDESRGHSVYGPSDLSQVDTLTATHDLDPRGGSSFSVSKGGRNSDL
jgi:hypothetical protein